VDFGYFECTRRLSLLNFSFIVFPQLKNCSSWFNCIWETRWKNQRHAMLHDQPTFAVVVFFICRPPSFLSLNVWVSLFQCSEMTKPILVLHNWNVFVQTFILIISSHFSGPMGPIFSKTKAHPSSHFSNSHIN